MDLLKFVMDVPLGNQTVKRLESAGFLVRRGEIPRSLPLRAYDRHPRAFLSIGGAGKKKWGLAIDLLQIRSMATECVVVDANVELIVGHD